MLNNQYLSITKTCRHVKVKNSGLGYGFVEQNNY